MKRRIACLLICVCLLLCMALPAGAQDEGAAFTDRGRIRNVGAVQMLVDLGLISGYDDGTFRPGNFITREEVAKLVAILCTENPQAPADVYFYDAQNSWALGYIGYCAGQGIIAGDGMGSFRPKDNVTAQELAKMLLVILGQDPYHEPGQAMGLSFSVPDGCKAPPSLRNIFKELEAELGPGCAAHTDLTLWARQGVLLLNTVLTVEQGAANAHAGRGWETFTRAALEYAAAHGTAPLAAVPTGRRLWSP